MQNKYLNDAIIGNKKIVASYTKKGELLRLYYPAPDNRQFIDYCYAGLKINDSGLVNLYDDINNEYKQYYTEDTNVLNTEIYNTYFNLKINQLDFVPIKENVLVKRYEFINEGSIDLDVKFLQHSKLLSNENNDVSCKIINQGMIQYTHDFVLSTVSKKTPLLSFQINDTNSNIHTGTIQDKDYIGMSADSSISYDIGILKPNEKKELCLFIWVNENKEKYKLDEIEHKNDEIKKIDIEKELQSTIKHWKRYVKEHSTLELKENTEYDKRIKQIYNRTILLYPLLINEETGGISASIEIDENKSKSGRYSYCWPRDAVFITKALDIIGMEKETEKFYKSFCKSTQSKSGMWEQRFYTDGRLAPCWGYQIDETASVIYGLYNHYEKTKNIKFIIDNFKMIEKASKFLQKYVEDVVEEKNKMHISYDLWEMHEGIHLYSMASIFAAFTAMIKMYEIIEQEKENKENKEQAKNRLKQEDITEQKEILTKDLVKIKNYVLKTFYNENKKCLKRNNIDEKMDISILGAVTPFAMFSPKEKKIANTVEKINLTLRTYTGGYRRFEDDNYMNGAPWPIATLWIALYYIEIKEYKKAKECLDFVVASSTKHGFLAEQVDNNTMESNWVIGLGWSHAMFIIVLEKLLKR
jgi:oligosaccharide amylase